MEETPLAVVGLDGVRLDVVERFSDDLPMLSGMLTDGASGTLRSTLPGPHSGPAWTTFSTGMNPGRHGISDWRLKRGYELQPATTDDVGAKRFWDYISDSGRTVGIFNIPLTMPPREVNGVLVTSWTNSLSEYTYPPSFQSELEDVGYERKAAFGSPDDPIENLLDSIEARRRGFERYLEQYDWDLFVGMFYETEQAHHQFASFLEPEHPHFDPSYEDKVKCVYRKIDDELAALRDTIGDANLIVMSDHGFCPIFEQVQLNRLLEQLGYYTPSDVEDTPHSATERALLKTVRRVKNVSAVRHSASIASDLPLVGRVVDGILSRYQEAEYSKQLTATWEETTAFDVYGHGGICINTIEDNPQGTVPGTERDDVAESLLADLQANKFISERVNGIYRREELFDGPHTERLPDIIIEFAEGYIGRRLYDDRLVIGPDEVRKQSGSIGFHTMDGLFLADGPDIEQGRLDDLSIYDIAPTVLHYFDCAVPSDMDGSPLNRVFTTESGFNRREVKTRDAGATDGARDELSESERRGIESNLEEMGYL